MHTLALSLLRRMAWPPVLLLAGCVMQPGTAAPTSVQNVRAVEIRYTHTGWGRTQEVHRLQRGAARRTFTRTSSGPSFDGLSPEIATVPAQRVGELLWALSAPPWPRERAVQVVARRVRPARVLEHATVTPPENVPACSADEIRDRMYSQLQGAALRSELDEYYQHAFWTDDYPMMRVVIEYDSGPAKVISSNSQKLLMLPWVLGERPAQGQGAPLSWSVPVSDALRRLLPPSSLAATRLGEDASLMLAHQIGHAAEEACLRESRGT